MKHSIQWLIATAHTYFPREIPRGDPRYEETPEVLRQKAARIPVSAQYDPWRDMLNRLRARFPEEQFPGVEVHNESLFLQVATAGTPSDRCFTGEGRGSQTCAPLAPRRAPMKPSSAKR